MRRIISVVLAAMMIVSLFAAATVSSHAADAFVYKELADGTLSLDKYQGEDTEVEIPSDVDGKLVTMVGDYAFSANKLITKVVVPETVKTLGVCAFNMCDKLREVRLPNGIKRIEMFTFSQCPKLKTINIPKSTVEIDNGAFEYCKSLESISLPENVTTVGYGAFANCSRLYNFFINSKVSSRVAIWN